MPFFLSFATGATHEPHQLPQEWADKYKGKFDQGWDKLRDETFARQKKLRVILQIVSSRKGTKRSRHGMRCRPRSSPCSSGRWRFTPASWSTLITMLAG